MSILILRPYYGINVSGDMAGDFGVIDYYDHIFPDLSLITSVSILEEANYDFDFIDANAKKLYPNEVVRDIKRNYDLILMKVAASTISLDIKFAKCLKKIFPSSKIVLTGRTATLLNEWIKKNVKEIDEVSLIRTEDYVNQLITGINKPLCLDDFPTPNYSLAPFNYYYCNSMQELRATLYTSRGCILHCSYCPYSALFEERYEERSLKKLGNDIEKVLSLGIRKLQFRDQYFSYKKERTLAICKMIKDRKLDFKWVCETKIDKIDRETLDVMIDSGMEMICFGIETPSKKIHKQYNRPMSNMKKLKEIIQFLHKKGTKTLGFYIVGFPNESWQDMSDTYNLALELETTYANFNVWTPFIGTKSAYEYFMNDNISLDNFKLFKNYMCKSSDEVNFQRIEFVANLFNFNYILHTRGLEIVNEENNLRERSNKRLIDGYWKSQSYFRKILLDYDQQLIEDKNFIQFKDVINV